MKEKLNILLLSSRKPSHSANLGQDVITSLTKSGHCVQFGFDGIEEVIDEQTRIKCQNIINKAYNKIHFYLRKYLGGFVRFLPSVPTWSKDGRVIFQPYEDCPPFSEKELVNRLEGDFDICVVLFWNNLITTKSLKAVYDKFHCPIIICAEDMMPFTGGCYYFGDCRNFEKECGNCPVCGGKFKNDQTHKNFIYKKSVYSRIECILFANTWQLYYVDKSRMFEFARTRKMNLNLDETIYAPRDVINCREKLGIPLTKKWVFLSRYRNIARKGMDVLIDGINRLYDSLPNEKQRESLLVLIGEKNDNINQIFKMEVLQLGFINMNSLIDAYNASTAFLCTSTDDAGPSMVNQSMACGTPVISFDTGTSVDMIDDGINGYKAPISEKDKWGDGLLKICALSDEEYIEMRHQAREKAVAVNGLHVLANAVEEVYQEFRPNGKK